MKKEEQIIAIAKACGWRKSDLTYKFCHPNDWEMAKSGAYGVWRSYDNLPDYLNDLNAMHEAEKVLMDQLTDWWSYHDTLKRMNINREIGRGGIVHATAAQRAEAFLKTLGLWEDGESN